MSIRLKPVEEQVMVITGASSGIGLATAQLAVERGARVVLVSRNAEALAAIASELSSDGGEVTYVAGDVAEESVMRSVAERAMSSFGRIDTWVNNAGVSIYGELTRVPPDDARRLFDTNYWGVVNGSRVAVEHMREHGGALINIGSVLSDLSMPLQGHYSASKQAVKGFTDALRMELEHSGIPIAVTLVKPTSIATPYPQHARNYMDAEPTTPPPVYDPAVVARTILACAEKPTRDVLVGGGARMFSSMGLTPRLADRYLEATAFEQQKVEGNGHNHGDILYHPSPTASYGATRGEHGSHVMRTSLYTAAAMHPLLTAFGTLAAVTALRALSRD
jgi:short-subunit dehydrogenase